jgi:hypothetical protein
MAETKTRPTDVNVADFLAAVEPADKRADALALDALFRKITGFTPRMWGPTMVGYGRYEYVYASGHGGTSMATGFSPRKAEHSIYILPGYLDMSDQLARLGKHKIGKACLYIKRLSDIHIDVLEAMIRAGLADLEKRWPVSPT